MAGRTIVDWLEHRQIVLYLVAIALGAGFGWLVPGSDQLEHVIEPVIALLLFATFLAVPFGKIRDAFRDVRFLSVVLVLNFVLVPIVVFGLSRFVATNQALLVGVLFVLLTPCIDYVIVFAGLAGGAAHKLLAAAPLLMLAQILLLPVYLLLFMGPSVLNVIDVVPFVRAFIVLIVIPLAAAALLQWLAQRSGVAQRVAHGCLGTMVPLMMLTLSVVVASQMRAVGAKLPELVQVVPVFIGFAIILVALGAIVSRFARLRVAEARALVFSGVTRNSLVVLPLALALPISMSLAPLVVVTQTLVELVTMVVLVRLLPLIIRDRSASTH